MLNTNAFRGSIIVSSRRTKTSFANKLRVIFRWRLDCKYKLRKRHRLNELSRNTTAAAYVEWFIYGRTIECIDAALMRMPRAPIAYYHTHQLLNHRILPHPPIINLSHITTPTKLRKLFRAKPDQPDRFP